MSTIKLPPRLTPVGYHIDEAYMVEDAEGGYYDRDEILKLFASLGVGVQEHPLIGEGSKVKRKGMSTPLWQDTCLAAGHPHDGVFTVSRVDYDSAKPKLYIKCLRNSTMSSGRIDAGWDIDKFELVEKGDE